MGEPKTVYADGGWKAPKPMTKKQFEALQKQGANKDKSKAPKGKSKNGGKS